MTAARNFVSMLGFKSKSARAEGDDEDKKKEEEDEDTTARAEGDEDDKEKENADDEGDDDEARAEGDGDDDEDDKDKKDAKKAAVAARSAERARCGAIFAYGIKMGMPELAGSLAIDTGMSVASAKATINTAKQFNGRRTSLADTMAGVSIPFPGSEGEGAPAGDSVARARSLYDAAVGRKAG